MSHYVRARWPGVPGAPSKVARVGGSYQAFVPDPVAHLDLLVGAATAQEVVDAEKAVQALQDRATAIAGLDSMASLLLRAESNASSRIEGLRVGQKRLARVAFDATVHDRVAREVVNNVHAMEAAIARARTPRRLAVDDIVAMHRVLLEATDESQIAGTVRTTQNWIGGNDWNPVGAAFVPPPPELVPDLLQDLVRFVARDDMPAVVQAAVAHAQFEVIHPFGDGNGRIGRCLIHAVLVRRGLAPRFVPPISLVLAANGRGYIAGLTAFRNGGVSEWISMFARSTTIAAQTALGLADEVAAQRERWLEAAGRPRQGSTAARLIERLAGTPIVDTAAVQEMFGVSHEAARTALLQLEEAGIIRSLSTSRYRRAWAANEVFDMVDAVERRLATPAAAITVVEPPAKASQRRQSSRLGTHRQAR